jgi:hypothetical protein
MTITGMTMTGMRVPVGGYDVMNWFLGFDLISLMTVPKWEKGDWVTRDVVMYLLILFN